MFEYIMIFVFLILGAMAIVGSVQMQNIRKRSQEWIETQAKVINTQGYEGEYNKDLQVEYLFEGRCYRAWASNAYNIPTRFVKIADVVRVKIDPRKPSKSVIILTSQSS